MIRKFFQWLGDVFSKCFQVLFEFFERLWERLIEIYNQIQEWGVQFLQATISKFLGWVLEHLPGRSEDYITGLAHVRRAFAYLDDFLPLHETIAIAGLVFGFWLIVKRLGIVFKLLRAVF